MTLPQLVIATKNQHKLEEIAAIVGDRFSVCGTESLDVSWEETGETFEDNARIKAKAIAKAVSGPTCILADDSGLMVNALGGAPGVYSARYAGRDGDDQANNEKLLWELKGASNRQAKFVCVLVYIEAGGRESVYRGECPGEILENPRGEAGFGYDPLFMAQGRTQSMAELAPEEKNAISHRRRALDEWIKNSF